MVRLLTNLWFWTFTFVAAWIVFVTILIADGYGSSAGQ